CYLAGGLLQTRGLPGLADGLRVLSDLFEQYWESLFPPLQRMRGRRNALQWLLDWVQRHAGEVDWSAMPPQEPEPIASLCQRLQAIDAVLRDKDEDAPSLRPLINLVNTLPVQEPVPEQESLPAPAAAAPGVPVPPQAPPVPQLQSGPALRALPASQLTPGALNAAADVDAVLEQVCGRLGELSGWWLNADFSSPLAFRLGRLAAWAAIDAAPPAEGGRTRIAPPISQILDALGRLLENQADEDLVRFAEAQLPVFPFWLDLNRISAQALARMGERFAAAQREVCGETARLMTRLPGLDGLAFANGTPFADDETLAWLATLAAAAGDAGAAAPASQPDGLATAVRNARALAADGDLAAAAAGLQRLLAQTAAPGQKLLLRIRLCELLFAERPGANLRPFAQAVIEEIERHDLVRWDPPLALDGLKAAYNILAQDEEQRAAADALLARIVGLDAGQAVALVT
ncbi:MAG TPA: type VI secretion system protein TssA, partial [Burkholderiaceae bacterium]|nr:type VI secretion system protein TssA [Burkholderiaceae bacterium]